MKDSSKEDEKNGMYERTAEEILKKYETYINLSGIPIFLRENVLKAMEEYRSLSKVEQVEQDLSEIKMKKIKCQCPCHSNSDIKHVINCCDNGYIEVPELPPFPQKDPEVDEWLKTVTDEQWQFATKLRDSLKGNMGTRGKMLIVKAMEEYAKSEGWIDCSERLPEKDGLVIAYDTDSLTPVKCLNFEDGRFYFEAHGVALDYTDHISMWQPLPKAPSRK